MSYHHVHWSFARLCSHGLQWSSRRPIIEARACWYHYFCVRHLAIFHILNWSGTIWQDESRSDRDRSCPWTALYNAATVCLMLLSVSAGIHSVQHLFQRVRDKVFHSPLLILYGGYQRADNHNGNHSALESTIDGVIVFLSNSHLRSQA